MQTPYLNIISRPKAFLKNTAGNIAMMSGLVALPFMAVFALAIDANAISTASNVLQRSCDAAVLSVASDLSNDRIEASETDQAFEDILNANLFPLRRMVVWNSNTTSAGSTVTGTISGQYDTLLGGFLSREQVEFEYQCVATMASSASELVLVLDTSRSMTGSRMDALRVSANNMISNVVTDGNDTSRMGIVPFTHHVNVGEANRNASWMSVAENYSVVDQRCSSSRAQYQAAGCIREQEMCSRDGQDQTCNRWVCPEGAVVEQTCRPRSRYYDFHGCVDSRPQDYRFNHDDYETYPVRGQLSTGGGNCASRTIVDLTSDVTTLTTTISQLSNSGDTYMAPGLVWGLRVLSPGEPFDSAADFETFRANNGRKAIVLMSDGENTRSPGRSTQNQDVYRGHWQKNDPDFADANTLTACNAIKAAGIELFTIAFDVQDEDTEKLLEDCATSEDEHYYLAANSIQLAEAFDQIGGAFREVRLIQPEQILDYTTQIDTEDDAGGDT
ncbi:MAG: pilus assembly protein TadG-related protein [Pseudomonadota bacterium]